MEQLNQSWDVLELGRHLVRELGLEDRVDTLGRWMAHHLAELIEQAEKASSDAERSTTLKEATDTILKLWEHRTALPGNAYPIAPYRNVLVVLDRLRLDRNPFRYSWEETSRTIDELTKNLFDGFSRLVVALLLMKMPSTDNLPETAPIAIEALEKDEQYILEVLQQWLELFEPVSKISESEHEMLEKDPNTKMGISDVIPDLIDDLMADLAELRANIKGKE